MASPFLRSELPATGTRLKWQAKIKAGLDTSEILGIGKNSSLSQQVAQLVTSASNEDIGAIENIEFVQNRTMVERYGFGPDPHTPFQVVPTSYSSSLRLDRVVLFSRSKADQVFNFAPTNLLFQQLPFVIQIGLPSQGNSAPITFYLLGCWFLDSRLNFGVTGSDMRLINTANVKITKVLTLDGTSASLDGGVATDVVGGILTLPGTSTGAQQLLSNINLT